MSSAKYEALRRDSEDHGENNDCSVIAVAAITGIDYCEAKLKLSEAGRKIGKGVNMLTICDVVNDILRPVGARLGKDATQKQLARHVDDVDLFNNDGLTVSWIERRPDLWKGRWLIGTRGHVLCAIDGVIHDWTAGKRSHRITNAKKVMFE